MRSSLLFVALLAAGFVAAKPASAKPAADLQVTAVRFWTLGDVTRVAIEASGDFTYKKDRLNNPDRLFFDIMDATPNVGGLRFSTRPVNDKMLKQIRIAETLPGRTRVVLDLNGSVEYTVSKLENPDRLMIELRSVGAKKSNAPPLITSSTPTTALPTAPPPLANPPAPATVPQAVNIVASVTTPPVVTDLAKPTRPDPTAALTTPSATATETSASPARRSTDGAHSLIRALGLKINRVVIDAGHGGHDVGTTGPTGLLEKDLVLDVALRLGKLIEQRLGAEVIYTRQDDSYVALEERTAIANRSHADLFLSIHANSSPIKAVAGVETFYLNFTSSSDALDVAARENASSQKSVFELRDLIQSISLHDKIEESKEFATDVQRSMQANAIRYISTAKDRGIKKAPFVVLIGAQMPSVLSEIGFISNPKEETLLKRTDHRQLIAEALFKGVSRYSDSLSHIQVASQSASPVPVKPDHEAVAPTGTAK
jgi:N-acetylmuramoyl-L-alanine amidase